MELLIKDALLRFSYTGCTRYVHAIMAASDYWRCREGCTFGDTFNVIQASRIRDEITTKVTLDSNCKKGRSILFCHVPENLTLP